jgi:hypothetical protein
MIPVETIPGKWVGGMKEKDGRGVNLKYDVLVIL